MIISDMMFKMRDKFHVCKYFKDCIGLIDIVPLCNVLICMICNLNRGTAVQRECEQSPDSAHLPHL